MAGRYQASKQLTYTSPDGVTVTYLAPRILPAGSSAAGPAQTAVAAGEVSRLDLVAYRTLGAALQAWQLADANDAMDPFELVASPGQTMALPGTGAGSS
jgi:hypothetical protein